jgi:tryptophan halogenase
MDRIGNGYAFCDDFITPDQAQQEIETVLGRKIQPVKHIKYDPGVNEKCWINNCLAIGLSSGFLEPLEATAIHVNIHQAYKFSTEYLRPTLEDTVNIGSVNIFNKDIKTMYDDICDFLVMHYMGGRTDSEFWRYIATGETRTPFVENIIQMCKSRMPMWTNFNRYENAAGWGIYNDILCGLGILSKDVCRTQLNDLSLNNTRFFDIAKSDYENYQNIVQLNLSHQLDYIDLIKIFKNKREEWKAKQSQV